MIVIDVTYPRWVNEGFGKLAAKHVGGLANELAHIAPPQRRDHQLAGA